MYTYSVSGYDVNNKVCLVNVNNVEGNGEKILIMNYLWISAFRHVV